MTECAVTLGELADNGTITMSDGYRTRSSELGPTGIPILRVGEVLDGRIAPRFKDHIRPEFRPAMGTKTSRAGDVVVTTKGTVGRVARVPDAAPEFAYSPQVCFFRVVEHSRIDSGWLYCWFRSPLFQRQSLSVQGQTDMAPYINLADVRAMTIQLPAVSEQRAIAEVLGALDDKIDCNLRVHRLCWSLAEASYRELVAGSCHTAGLGSVLDLAYGKSLPERERVPGDVPVYGSGGVVGWHDRSLVDGPGVVVGRKGTAGAVHWTASGFYPIDTTFYVRPRPDTPMLFLYFALKLLELDRMNSDSAVPGLNRNAAIARIIRLPDVNSLRSFAAFAQPLVDTAESARRESELLARLRETLLPRLLSGEIRVRDAEEVAGRAM